MTANKPFTDRDWVDLDDAPDLSTPEWRAVLEATPVTRGRPKSERPKVSTTIRLDADVLESFKSGGRGWQSRINEILRSAISKA
jgi:uncharacterized protein (DUF4415 family)